MQVANRQYFLWRWSFYPASGVYEIQDVMDKEVRVR